MGSLKRRVESLEAARTRGEAQPPGEALGHLSDEELDALEENDVLEEMKQWEAEQEERVRIHTEESRRRDRELLERNHALIRTRRR